jgi:hypothetical protein
VFYIGAPQLDRIQTPANQRTDVTTDPDIYNQTTAADMGRLLAAIERCASSNNGLLVNTFSGKILQSECQEMTGLMAKNRKGVLLEAGVPEGTQMGTNTAGSLTQSRLKHPPLSGHHLPPRGNLC